MNLTDKISKEVLNVLDYSKEVVKTNLTTLNSKDNSSPLTEAQLERVVNVINVSLSQGFQKALPNFQKALSRLVVDTNVKQEAARKKK